MLRDRKELIEYEIEKTKAEAAMLYLEMIKDPEKVQVLRTQYEFARSKVIDFEFDLTTINELIDLGHK